MKINSRIWKLIIFAIVSCVIYFSFKLFDNMFAVDSISNSYFIRYQFFESGFFKLMGCYSAFWGIICVKLACAKIKESDVREEKLMLTSFLFSSIITSIPLLVSGIFGFRLVGLVIILIGAYMYVLNIYMKSTK
ncbi:hypothetical protein [Foetidibacter luteolus]|uniref:hypothetical protein n=1 Tax=Foetidibacter luteolus TaxID=2608880 RepID=UPI00129B77B6|nr:hypothetical protein [Foetidibacter luteolus]